MNKSVFVLHGWTFETKKWAPFLAALKEVGLSPTLLKTPGLTSPLNSVWNLDNYVEWLAGKLKNETKVVLLGHSFGGQIAVRFAASYPDKVSQLILIDSAGVRDHSLWPTIKRAGFRVAANLGKMIFSDERLRKVLYFFARERDYLNAPPLLRRTMSAILDDEVVGDMPKVLAPTLLIWGRRDAVTPLKLARIFVEKIPQNRLAVIDEARHGPQFSHKTEVANLCKQFLS